MSWVKKYCEVNVRVRQVQVDPPRAGDCYTYYLLKHHTILCCSSSRLMGIYTLLCASVL
jgi:hypothetical protein